MNQTLLYEGKAKKVYTTQDPSRVLVEFKDDATAFNGQKKGQIVGKGIINTKISAHLFRLLENHGIETHFIDQPSDNTLIVERLRMVPLEVVVRNVVAGSLKQRTGLEEGTILAFPIVEFYFKNDALGDPLINEDHIRAMNLASTELTSRLKHEARRINDILQPYLEARGLQLVDFKLEFGMADGDLKLGDEISPDTCRLWDKESHKKLDKDRFRQDLGAVEDAYREVLERILS
ncbi:MAG: phosphoribosylaminoimidazolesuccinocarboxamide synthase [Sulfobacillus sp.]